jgi:hypothetical protein
VPDWFWKKKARAPEPQEAGVRGALFAEVLRDPSPEACTVLADQLLEAGDARGELINVELALASRPSPPRRERLSKRRAELVRAHASAWWPWPFAAGTAAARNPFTDGPRPAAALRTRHGFVVGVRCDASAFLPVAADVFAREPVTALELLAIDADGLDELVEAPWLPRLRRLTLRGALGDAGFKALARAPGLRALEALNLPDHGIGVAGLSALGDCLPSLGSLGLTANPLGGPGAGALARWRHLPNLRSLYLARAEINGAGLARLLDGRELPAIEKLCLGGNPLGDAGVVALCQHAGGLSALRHLELDDVRMSDVGAEALARAPFARLTRLDARGNRHDPTPLLQRYPGAVRRLAPSR